MFTVRRWDSDVVVSEGSVAYLIGPWRRSHLSTAANPLSAVRAPPAGLRQGIQLLPSALVWGLSSALEGQEVFESHAIVGPLSNLDRE